MKQYQRAETWRRRISESHKRNGIKPPSRRGAKFSKEQLKRLSDAHKGYVMPEAQKQKIRLARLRQILPVEDTRIEVMAQESLVSRGIPFIAHPVIEDICQPDIQLTDSKVLIFCDGCYWHGCPEHFPKNRKPYGRDRGLDTLLRKAGWQVVRFWAHQFEANPDVVGIWVDMGYRLLTEKELKIGR